MRSFLGRTVRKLGILYISGDIKYLKGGQDRIVIEDLLKRRDWKHRNVLNIGFGGRRWLRELSSTVSPFSHILCDEGTALKAENKSVSGKRFLCEKATLPNETDVYFLYDEHGQKKAFLENVHSYFDSKTGVADDKERGTIQPPGELRRNKLDIILINADVIHSKLTERILSNIRSEIITIQISINHKMFDKVISEIYKIMKTHKYRLFEIKKIPELSLLDGRYTFLFVYIKEEGEIDHLLFY